MEWLRVGDEGAEEKKGVRQRRKGKGMRENKEGSGEREGGGRGLKGTLENYCRLYW